MTLARTGATARWIGLLVVLLAIVWNQWSLAWLFSPDWHIEAARNLKKIWKFQALIAGTGLVLLFVGRPRLAPILGRVFTVLAVVLILGGVFGLLRVSNVLLSSGERDQMARLDRMHASEATLLELQAKRLKPLTESLRNLGLPSGSAVDVFADEVVVLDLDSVAHAETEELPGLEALGVRTLHWHMGTETTVAREDLSLLAPLLDRMRWVESGKFYHVSGDYVGDDRSRWNAHAGFRAFGAAEDGGFVFAHGDIDLAWKLPDSLDPVADAEEWDSWVLTEFKVTHFETIEAERTLFREVLDEAIPDAAVRAEARRNRAQEFIVEMALAANEGREWVPPHEFFRVQAGTEMPGVSVVDLDRDGFDDFYVMPRYGRNKFFRNQGDGTFEEIAGELGLDVENYTTCALFADFDNDGDHDAFLGRTLERSKYLENVGGRFEDRSAEAAPLPLPHFVVTASAVDYDNDGLLDVFLGTHAGLLLGKEIRMRRPGNRDGKFFSGYLRDDQASRVFDIYITKMENRVRDRVGPPNALLRNLGGGRFEEIEDTPLSAYRNTFQVAFSDYDDDGDPDAYMANDFAPNLMLENRDGLFVDVTEETNGADIGFGMGASWGDFDQDGDQDLYVSNMFSKAGRRVLALMTEVDGRMRQMAAGNSLLELDGGKFERVSSIEGPGMHVEMAGWSWAGQWFDFDRDSWLDLFALSGHYTAPREISAGHDL